MKSLGRVLSVVIFTGVACLAPALSAMEVRPGPAESLEGEISLLETLEAALPAYKHLEPKNSPTLPENAITFGEGVLVEMGKRVILPGTILFTEGPTDGLEVLACLQGGKTHESMVVLDCNNAQLLKTACIAALGLQQDGEPGSEISAVPGLGTPVRVILRWQPDAQLEPNQWVEADASTLIRNRITNRAYPPLPYVYTGSRIETHQVDLPDGRQVRQQRFMFEVTKSMAVNFDEPDALMASPYPLAVRDDLFEVDGRRGPTVAESSCYLILERIDLPIVYAKFPGQNVKESGSVYLQNAGQKLSDEAFLDWLKTSCIEKQLSAFVIRVPAQASAADIQALRRRSLRVAAALESPVYPLFQRDSL